MTTNPTEYLNLSRPNFNVSGWHTDVNGNFLKLDNFLRLLGIVAVDYVWENATAYVAADRVFDPDTGTIWDCLVNHTSAASGSFATDRTAHPSYWAQVTPGFVWRGGWVTATAYRVQDIISQNGNMYVCIEAHTSGVFATDLAAAKWELVVEKGATGPGTGDVVGPASSVNGRVATFDGTTGKLLADNGVLLSELATLASPAFTGTPTVPNQSANDNSTKIANTAYVDTAVAAALTAIRNGVSASYDTLAEIATALGTFLIISNNLSDVGNAATAFSNIKQAATSSATGVVELLTLAELYTGTDSTRVPTAAIMEQAGAEVALTDAASVVFDMSLGVNFSLALTTSRTLANATNFRRRSGRIRVVQPVGGGCTLSFSSDYEFAQGTAVTLDTGASKETVLYYDAISSGRILISAVKAIA